MEAEAPPTACQLAEALLLDTERRRKLLRYACVQFGVNEEDAEDLLQETALELLRYQSYVHSPEGFVFTVFRTRCARFSGSRRAKGMVFSKAPGAEADAPQPKSDGLDDQLALREALAGVSSACQRLIRAYYLEGQSLREAAATMSLAYSSIGRTISRCLRKLRECMV